MLVRLTGSVGTYRYIFIFFLDVMAFGGIYLILKVYIVLGFSLSQSPFTFNWAYNYHYQPYEYDAVITTTSEER